MSLGNRWARAARGPRSGSRTLRWRRLLAVTAAGLLAGVVAILGVGAPAQAHGQFVSADPAAGATVGQAIDKLLLYFTEKPTSNAYFSVTSPSGARVDRLWSHGDARALDTPVHEWFRQPDGKWVAHTYPVVFPAQVPIAYWPETGAYTVVYLSVATDGERVGGQFTFTYAGPVEPAPPDFQPQAATPDPNLVAVASAAPTPPSDGLTVEEQVAQEEAGPGVWIVWVPVGIAVLVALTVYLFWQLRPQLVRELMVSRFGGRYAAPPQRRPLRLPSAVAQRLPELPARLQDRLPVRLQERLPGLPGVPEQQSPTDDEAGNR